MVLITLKAKLMKYSIILLCLISLQNVSADEKNPYENNIGILLDEDAAARNHQQFYDFKKSQNDLSDNDREKKLLHNQYWLINKKQNLWMGIFDGNAVRVPGTGYPGIKPGSYIPQQILRIRNGERLSQFILKSTGATSYDYPLYCYNKTDAVLIDKTDYVLLYSGCTNILSEKNGKRMISYNILFYSKIFDTLVSINEFDSSVLIDEDKYANFLRRKQNYFIYDKTNIAFRINGKDFVENVDPDTGIQLSSVSDDPENSDGFQIFPLERIPVEKTNGKL